MKILKKIHSLVLIVPFLLAFSLVTAAIALAQISQTNMQDNLRGAEGLNIVTEQETVTATEMVSEIQTLPEIMEMDGIVSFPPEFSAIGELGFNPATLQPGFTIDMAFDAVMGILNPGDLVTVSVGTSYGAAVADASGFFWTPVWTQTGQRANLASGVSIDIHVNGSLVDTVTPVNLNGGMDIVADQVNGCLLGLEAGVPVTVTVAEWGSLPGMWAPFEASSTGSDGVFTAIFSDMDLTAVNNVQVDYRATSLSSVRAYLHSTSPAFAIENLNRVGGYAYPGRQMTVTVFSTYPTDIRWQGLGVSSGFLGFYNVTGVIAYVGDVIEVYGGSTPVITTTILNIQNITFDPQLNQVGGTAPQGNEVLVYFYERNGDTATYQETHVIAGPGDVFTANLSADLRASDSVRVFVSDANGNSTITHGGAPYIEALIDPTSNYDCVIGRVEAPNQPVTLSIQTASGLYTSTVTTNLSGVGNEILPPGMCYLIRGSNWGPIDFSPGDLIRLQSPNWSGSLTVADLTWQADSSNNQIVGSAPDGEIRVDVSRWHHEYYPDKNKIVKMTSASAGSFTADFNDCDLLDRNTVFVRHFDPVSDFVTQSAGANYRGTQIHYFVVKAPWEVVGRVNTPNESVTASLYDQNGNWLVSSSVTATLWDFTLTDFQDVPFAPGYWITVTGSSGWHSGFQIPGLTVDADENTNTIWGEGPSDRLYLETQWGFGRFFPSNGMYIVAPPGHQIVWGDGISVYYTSPSGNQFRQSKHWPRMTAQYGPDTLGNRVWGEEAGFSVSLPVTVTDPGGPVVATTTAQTDIYGVFDLSTLPEGSIAAGNLLAINFGSSGIETMEVLPITGVADNGTEFVTVTAPAGTPIRITAEGSDGWWDSSVSLPGLVVGPDGTAIVNLAAYGYDIVPGTIINVYTTQLHNHSTQYTFHSPVLHLRTNYGQDWVEGDFPAGHTIWLTATNSAGQLIATAAGVTGPYQDGKTGFSTQTNVRWLGLTPDLQAGDWMTVEIDDGQVAVSQLGAIEAVADVNTDQVAGTVNAPWYTDPLSAGCSVWEQGGAVIEFIVEPDQGAFICDFSGQWNLLPGQQVGVWYIEPDGDQVMNMASNAAPSLSVQTWAAGQPASGSNLLLYIEYRNAGNAATVDAVITATLEGGLTYLGDSSALPVSGTGTPSDPLVWQVGVLPADDLARQFSLFAQVDALPGEVVTNTVAIDNGVPYTQEDPSEKLSQWSAQVVENETDLSITKSAWTFDPLPGSEFVYSVNICNQGATDSLAVVVTDTLPLSTTLVTWWSQYAGWEELSRSPHELVLSRATLAGETCSEVYLNVVLNEDAWTGMTLHNTAWVYSGNDLNPENNEAELWHQVGYAHANLGVEKEWDEGALVPGGQIEYTLFYYNDGNLSASEVCITDTLPARTSFIAAYWYDDTGGHPFTPSLVTEEIAVWEIGALPAGHRFTFEVVLEIDPGASPGLELVNTAEITRLEDEDRYDDNTSTWREFIFGYGPNLRVSKIGGWQDENDGHSAWFTILVENVGDTTAEHVTVTDTLPVSLTLSSDPDTDWSEVEAYIRNDAEGWFSLTYSELPPGWMREITMDLGNPSPDPVPGGQLFTNHAEITRLANESSYEDNTTQYTLGSGPDLYVTQSLAGGQILPNEVITLSLIFGNTGWWDLQGTAWLTDVLPVGSEFVTAIQRWCSDGTWCPAIPQIQEGELLWNLGEFGVDDWNEIYLSIRLPGSLADGDWIVNQAGIFSDQPDLDIEPDTANNIATYQIETRLPDLQVAKEAESSAVAGMTAVYTITVSNSGSMDGSGIVVRDLLPVGITYLSGGSYDPVSGEVEWLAPSLPVGTEVVLTFMGQLACEAGLDVVNDTYRVTGSDQGVVSPAGPPVTVTVIEPTITAGFTASALSPITGENVIFTANAVTDGTPLTYTWDFGDGGVGTGEVASHSFNQAGSYEVVLTVTDECGYSTTYSLVVEVQAGIQTVYLPLVGK